MQIAFFLAIALSAAADDRIFDQPAVSSIDAEPTHVFALERVEPPAPAAAPEGAEPSDWTWARLTGGVMINIPFFDIEGSVGVELFNGILEAGVQGGAMPIVTLLVGGGAYVKLAPVPVGIGKRFYVVVRQRRYWVLDESAGVDHFDYRSLHLGYQQPLEDPDSKRMFWYVEAGAMEFSRVFRDASSPRETKYVPSVAAGIRY